DEHGRRALVERHVLDQADGLHAAQRAQAIHEVEAEARERRSVAEPRLFRRDLEREDVARAVAGIDVAEPRVAPEQETRADEQDERQRGLRGDEKIAGPAPASRAAAAAVAECRYRGTCAAERRRQAAG